MLHAQSIRSPSPRARRTHVAQMLALGGHHRLRASMKVRAEQRDRERKHEEYKRELHEAAAARTLPAVPPAAHAPHAPHAQRPSPHAAASHAPSGTPARNAADELEDSINKLFEEANGAAESSEQDTLRALAVFASRHWIPFKATGNEDEGHAARSIIADRDARSDEDEVSESIVEMQESKKEASTMLRSIHTDCAHTTVPIENRRELGEIKDSADASAVQILKAADEAIRALSELRKATSIEDVENRLEEVDTKEADTRRYLHSLHELASEAKMLIGAISRSDATTPATGACDAHAITTNTDDADAYSTAIRSCSNLMQMHEALKKGELHVAFEFMARILGSSDSHSPTSRDILIKLLQGGMKTALPFFAIKEIFDACKAASGETATVKIKHILKILDLSLAWHQRENASGHDAITKLRKAIAQQWYKGGGIITPQDVSALRDLARQTAGGDVYEAIPPTEFSSCLKFHGDVPEEDKEWTQFVLHLLCTDDSPDLLRDVMSKLNANLNSSADTKALLGNVQAAWLLLKSHRVADQAQWNGAYGAYIAAFPSKLSSLERYDQEPLLQALAILKHIDSLLTSKAGKSDDHKTRQYIDHMEELSKRIQATTTDRARTATENKRDIVMLVSGSELGLAHAFTENEHQRNLPLFFATEVLRVLKTIGHSPPPDPVERMHILKAFDARFPNMDEATILEVGRIWLNLLDTSVSAFGAPDSGTDTQPLVHLKKGGGKMNNKRQPSTATLNAMSSAPSPVPDGLTIQRVLDACNRDALAKPPRGAYLTLAQHCSSDDARKLLACVTNDQALTKTIFDESGIERTVADLLIQHIEKIQATEHAKGALGAFGRTRRTHSGRSMYAMSPWTAV